MNLKHLLKASTVLAFLMLSFYACRKELQTQTPIQDSVAFIREAKVFFESDVLKKDADENERHGFGRRFLTKTNQWDQATIKQFSFGSVVIARSPNSYF